jgi:ABC-2 type transport system ATP-binding protein
MAEKHTQNGTSFLLTSHQPLDPEELPNAKELLVENQTLNF